MKLSKSSYHKIFLILRSIGSAVPEIEMVSDALKVSLIKLAAAQRSFSIAATTFGVQLQLLLSPRQYVISEHFDIYLPCTDMYIAHATWHTEESLVEKNWLFSVERGIVLGLGGDTKKELKWSSCTLIVTMSTMHFKYYLGSFLMWKLIIMCPTYHKHEARWRKRLNTILERKLNLRCN